LLDSEFQLQFLDQTALPMLLRKPLSGFVELGPVGQPSQPGKVVCKCCSGFEWCTPEVERANREPGPREKDGTAGEDKFKRFFEIQMSSPRKDRLLSQV
jgi:hypothetical protein